MSVRPTLQPRISNHHYYYSIIILLLLSRPNWHPENSWMPIANASMRHARVPAQMPTGLLTDNHISIC